VVWYISVGSNLGAGGVSGLSHEVTHVGPRYLSLVHAFLVVLPAVFSVPLLLGQVLVGSLEILQVLSCLVVLLVFEHASHPCDGIGLLGVLLLFSILVLSGPVVFSFLLFDPILLQVLVLGLSYTVGYNRLVKCKASWPNTYPNLLPQTVCIQKCTEVLALRPGRISR
jgi:hypothetical protein